MLSSVAANTGPSVVEDCGNVSGIKRGFPLGSVKFMRVVVAELPRLTASSSKLHPPPNLPVPENPPALVLRPREKRL